MAYCPECGFELLPHTACAVCGFRPRNLLEQDGDPDQKQALRRLRSGTRRAVFLAVFFSLFSAVLYTSVPSQTAAGKRPSALPGSPLQTSQPAAPILSSRAADPAAAVPSAPSGLQPPVKTLVPAFDITKRTHFPPTDSETNFVKYMLSKTKEKEGELRAKWARSREILKRPDITEEHVLQAFLAAPRQYFCRSYNIKNAYADAAMPIGYGQTISGPHMVSRMTQSLNLQPSHHVLEIGTGSGYQSAVLSELSNFVFTIEIVPELTSETDKIYSSLEKDYPQYANIKRRNSDGYYGWEEFAPFDKIIVTCGIDHIPPPLLRQLAPNGTMVIPVGPPSGQTVLKVTKVVGPEGTVTLEREDIFHGRKVIFVPFTAGKGDVHSLENERKREKK